MRSKKTIINTLFSMLEELVAIICAFILPRLILEKFGSSCNGLITSITQFLACAVLLRSGIGGATRAALYKPLAENNKDKINSIMKATDQFMKKVGLILIVLILALAVGYPLFINKEFEFIYSFSLILIIGASSFAESFFGITYLIMVQADQKLWVSSAFKIISQVLNIVFAVILIKLDFSIHLVKLFSTIAFLVYPIGLNIYVKKKYKLNFKNVEADKNSISQRWDAFWHQVSDFVTHNTDVVVLSIFTNLLVVSVYSVYSLVLGALKRFIAAFAGGLESALGNMVAKKEKDILKENVTILEFIFFNLGTFVYTCGILLICDFVRVYTKGITDTNYLIPFFSYILMIAQFFTAIRMPYQQVIQASGHYKQTKKYAIIESFLNIIVSSILVIKFGLIGISIGTLIALAYKTIMYVWYTSKNIIEIKLYDFLKKILLSIVEATLIILIYTNIKFIVPSNYFDWIINSVIVSILAAIIIGIGIILIYKKESSIFLQKIKKSLKKS